MNPACDCGRPVHAKGLCARCYAKARREQIRAGEHKPYAPRLCKVYLCGAPYHAKGLCKKCYAKERRKTTTPYYHLNREKVLAELRQRYAEDPEYREDKKRASKLAHKRRKHKRERLLASALRDLHRRDKLAR